jgi:hypothetical protein
MLLVTVLPSPRELVTVWLMLPRNGLVNVVVLTALTDTDACAPVADSDATAPFARLPLPSVIAPTLLTPATLLTVWEMLGPVVRRGPPNDEVRLSPMLDHENAALPPTALTTAELPIPVRPLVPLLVIVPPLLTTPVLRTVWKKPPPTVTLGGAPVNVLPMLAKETPAVAPAAPIRTEAPSPEMAPTEMPVLALFVTEALLVGCWMTPLSVRPCQFAVLM